MVDLHRHDEYSTFDGFGKATELAKLAKELGHTSLGTSNHGNTNGLVQTYLACKENDIKPILGVEGYFLPKYKEQSRGYHLCIFAKDFFIQNLSTGQFCKEYFIELLFCIIAEAVPECRDEADVSVGADHERAYG